MTILYYHLYGKGSLPSSSIISGNIQNYIGHYLLSSLNILQNTSLVIVQYHCWQIQNTSLVTIQYLIVYFWIWSIMKLFLVIYFSRMVYLLLVFSLYFHCNFCRISGSVIKQFYEWKMNGPILIIISS